jgi:hypothetical protein
MKKSELRQLIREEIEKITQEVYEPIDEMGKFYIVEKPKRGSKKEDIMRESTAFDEIIKDNTIGIYKQRSDANRAATEAIKEYETKLNELESQMEEFRKYKSELEEKKKKAKDTINNLK